MSLSVANNTETVVVLVVEDEFLLRWDIAACLRDAGYAVFETGSGEEAMILCKSDMAINIVFTDINLEGSASGWDVGDYFRALRPDISVLYTSGKSIEGRDCGPRGLFLAKPYKHGEVLAACDRLRGQSTL